MKIKKDIDLDILLEYGFTKINKKEELLNEEYFIAQFDYMFRMGHSRRGQFYYLFVKSIDRIIQIYASDPDGSGSNIPLHNIIFKMFLDQIIEP